MPPFFRNPCDILGMPARYLEVQRVKEFGKLPPVGDADFVTSIGLQPASEPGQLAVQIRKALARLAEVPPESISASHRSDEDLSQLPFFDSLDVVGLLIAMEETLGSEIPDENAENMHFLVRMDRLTVGEFVIQGVYHFSRMGRRS